MKSTMPCTMLFFLIVIAVTGTGCIGADYVPNHDIIIAKLSSDCTTDWTITIDEGFDDTAADIIEISDGGFVLAAKSATDRYGPYDLRLIRISPDGALLPDYEPVGNYDFTALVQASGGGFAAVTGDGNVLRLGPDGNLLWETATGITDTAAIMETTDGGFVVAGVRQDSIPFGSVPVYDENGNVSYREPFPDENVPTPGCHEKTIKAGDREITVTECTVPVDIIRQAAVVKLDGNGKISWNRGYGDTGMNSARSIIEGKEGNGFIVTGYETIRHDELNYTNYIEALLLDVDGKAIHAERIGCIEFFGSLLLYEAPGGYDVLYVNTTLVNGYYCNKQAEAHFDMEERRVTSVNILDTGIVLTRTDDGGYFTAGFPREGGCAGYSNAVYSRSDEHRLHAALFDPDGSIIREREIDGISVNSVEKVMQTSDGGYIILALNENYY